MGTQASVAQGPMLAPVARGAPPQEARRGRRMAKRVGTARRAASGVRTAFLQAPALGPSLQGDTSRPRAQVEVRERAAQVAEVGAGVGGRPFSSRPPRSVVVAVAAVGPADREASVQAVEEEVGARSGSSS